MNDLIWLNGRTIARADARVDIEDRGFQFADGVYEVLRLYDGRAFTLDEHLDRLDRSAAGVKLRVPLRRDHLVREIAAFVARTGARDGLVYMQLTRGVAPRNHLFPPGDVEPTLLFYTRPVPPTPPPGAGPGVRLLPMVDDRWRRCWIKAIALLPNVLAKNEAAAAGCDEAAFVEDDGTVSECASSNLFAVIGGRVVTCPAGPKVLPGVTRLVVRKICGALGIPVEERPPRESECAAADELFITSTTREIGWVDRWGDHPIGAGRCGPITRRLHEAFRERVAKDTTPADARPDRRAS